MTFDNNQKEQFSNNKDNLFRLLEKAKKDLNIKLYYCNCRNVEEFLTLPTSRICEINKRSEHNYSDVQIQLRYIQKIEDKLQKLFEQESHEFLEKFKYEIITEHNLYHIKYSLQHILRSYENNNFVKVQSFGNKLNISQYINDCNIEIH